MVAGCRESLGHALEYVGVPVGDGGGLPVHEARGPHNLAPEVVADRLVAEADAEDRLLARKRLDDVEGDTRLAGRAWPRGQEDPVRVQGQGLLGSDLVVPEYPLFHAHLTEVQDEVVGKGIEVIDDEEHRLIIDPRLTRGSRMRV